MLHFNILSSVFCLLSGACAIAYFQQKSRRFSNPVMGFILGYMIVYNLNGLVYLFSLYLNFNLSPNEFKNLGSLFPEIDSLVQSLLTLGQVSFLFKTISCLREKKMPGWFMPSMFFFMTILTILQLRPHRFPGFIPKNNFIFNYSNVFYGILILLTLGWLLRLLAENRFQSDLDCKRAVNGFAWLFLSRIPIQVALHVLATLHLHQWAVIISKLLILYTNIIPLLWLHFYFIPWAGSLGKIIGNYIDFQSLQKVHGLSDREMQILKLLIDGKSYKEMVAVLFISMHTVKSHVYNLYRKMKVKNRHQLTHLIRTFRQKNL